MCIWLSSYSLRPLWFVNFADTASWLFILLKKQTYRTNLFIEIVEGRNEFSLRIRQLMNKSVRYFPRKLRNTLSFSLSLWPPEGYNSQVFVVTVVSFRKRKGNFSSLSKAGHSTWEIQSTKFRGEIRNTCGKNISTRRWHESRDSFKITYPRRVSCFSYAAFTTAAPKLTRPASVTCHVYIYRQWFISPLIAISLISKKLTTSHSSRWYSYLRARDK